jgi:hypothetical protein
MSSFWSVFPGPFGNGHYPIFISIPYPSFSTHFMANNIPSFTAFNYYKANWISFTYHVSLFNEYFTLSSSSLSNYNSFINVLLNATDKSIYLKYIHRNNTIKSPL